MIITKYKDTASVFIILSVLYVGLSFLMPADKMTLTKYKISTNQLHALVLTIVIPYLIIWFIALVGYLRLRSYTEKIATSKDGQAFQMLARGIFVLALWLPVSAIIGALTSWYMRAQPSSSILMVNLNNYSTLLILLLAFTIIYQGSQKLLAIIKKPQVVLPLPVMIVFITFSALYVFLVLHDPARQFPTHSVTNATYYLPDWLTVMTIVIPRLITWYIGIRTVHNIYMYRLKVKGPIYIKALDNLAKGVAWVVITIIILRCFQSLSTQLSNLSLGVLFLVVYALLAVISVGFVLISKGAKSLQQIEEV